MKSDILSYKNFRSGFAWVILIIGVGLYALGFFFFEPDSVWKEIVLKIADVLVIGVILGYLTNVSSFLGVFKEDLQNIIYGKEFIEQRKDLSPLWETISKQMFKNKFPAIHKRFLSVISGYFPKEEISYCDEYSREITIDWINKESGQIKVTEIVRFDLVAESRDIFSYPIKTWTKVSDKKNYTNQTTDFQVNGESVELGDVKEFCKDGEFCQEYTIELEGDKKYEIQYTRVKIYNIHEDYFIGFRANYIVNKLNVDLEYPEGIDVTFICRGTQLDFENIKCAQKRRIKKRYKGIILPRQGYIFALREIK